MDGELVATAAAAYLRVLQDEVGARDLLAEARREVRLRQVAEICHRELRGNVLWHYPKLVAEVQGVLQIGACADDVAAAWDRLELPTQLYVEARADHCAELERCEPVVPGRRRAIVEAVLGAEVGSAALRFGDDPSRASLLRQHPLAVVAERFRQRHEVPVPLATLDELVARGEVDPDGCNLLYVDVEGTELEVLRGAVATLPHFDLVCVAVYLLPVYDGAPLLQEIQTFLHDFDPEGEHGFGLRAFELGADPGHGHAVFRRLKPRT
ncbi:MAG: FkbM family methyltransferase [Planctomycetes bacterium]|nr:FkbM family methyltransferase [Planctomycetota bacterium]